MGYQNTTLTHTSNDPTIRAALQAKVRNPGVHNPRVEFMLQSLAQNDDDSNLLNLCSDLMEDIALQQRNAYDGSWKWRCTLRASEFTDVIINWICSIIGAWTDYDGSYYILRSNNNVCDWLV